MHSQTTLKHNKNQSNFVKRGIALRFYSPGGSRNLQLHVLAGGLTRKSSLPLGIGGYGTMM